MHISKLSPKQLWIVSAAIPFVFAFLFFTVLLLGEVFHVEVSGILDQPALASIFPVFFYPGILLAGPIGLLFAYLFPSSDIGLSLIFIIAPLVSFLIYTCIIRVILDFALKYFYEKR